MAKTVFYNAKVYVEKGVFAEAVMQEDGWIKMVGTNEEVLAAAEGAEKIDCEGRTLIPGLNDSHMHILQLGMAMDQVDMSGCKSVEEMIEVGKQYLKDHPGCRGLFTQSWNDDNFYPDKKRLPDRHDMDKISTEIPLCIARICGHSCVVNTLALEMMGLDENNHFVEGGEVVLEESGYPNGYLYENAQADARLTIPPYTVEELKDCYRRSMKYAVEHGMTTTQSNDYRTVAPMEAVVQALTELYESGEAPMRYVAQCGCENIEQMKEYAAGCWKKTVGPDKWMEYGPAKMFKDGSLGARSALMRKPYADAPDMIGVERISDEKQDEMIEYASKIGMQIATHCIGDGAIDITQKLYAKHNPADNPCRHSIVHYQITDMDMVEFTKEHNIYACYQPIFLHYDLNICADRVGEELAKTSYCFKTAYEKGIHASFGTDCPVEDCNPFLNLWSAMCRTDFDGKPEGGWLPEEKLDAATAIDMYTVESAFHEFKEDVKGRIKPGYMADIVVMDKDIFTCDPMEVKDILPVITMVGGKIVYRR